MPSACSGSGLSAGQVLLTPLCAKGGLQAGEGLLSPLCAKGGPQAVPSPPGSWEGGVWVCPGDRLQGRDRGGTAGP